MFEIGQVVYLDGEHPGKIEEVIRRDPPVYRVNIGPNEDGQDMRPLIQGHRLRPEPNVQES